MKYKSLVLGAAGAAILFGAATVAARSYNPMKWIKKPTASQELAANSTEEKALTLQLQALLPARTTLKDACTLFKALDDCVASLRASSNLQIKFNCLKWNMTAVRPNGDIKSCQAPPKAQQSGEGILALKPDVNARGGRGTPKERARRHQERPLLARLRNTSAGRFLLPTPSRSRSCRLGEGVNPPTSFHIRCSYL